MFTNTFLCRSTQKYVSLHSVWLIPMICTSIYSLPWAKPTNSKGVALTKRQLLNVSLCVFWTAKKVSTYLLLFLIHVTFLSFSKYMGTDTVCDLIDCYLLTTSKYCLAGWLAIDSKSHFCHIPVLYETTVYAMDSHSNIPLISDHNKKEIWMCAPILLSTRL